MKFFHLHVPVVLSLMFPVCPVLSQEQDPELEKVDYIRFQSAGTGGEPDLLQTAVVRFQRRNVIVDLVAAVHLGDKKYFENLNLRLKQYDAVLYEMVGGRYPSKEAQSTKGDLSDIRTLQTLATQLLNLEFQIEGIDYKAPNFVHADVSWAQYQKLKEAKNQSMATFLARAVNLAQSGKIAGIPGDDASVNNLLSEVLTALSTGDSAWLKRKIAPILSEAESMIAQIEGNDGTVIVSERNKVVMAKLKEALARSGGGTRKIAVFYGAGHMPDLEKRLIADGFQKMSRTWLTAWKISDQAVDPSAPPAAADFFNQLLQENPRIKSLIQDFSKALEDGNATGN